MSKFTLLTLILVFSVASVFAFDPTKQKDSHLAVFITNPLSGASKIGGLVEMRLRLSSFCIGATDYIGGYTGIQYKFEYHKYLYTERRNEYFWYLKAFGGDVTYEADKLMLVGDGTNKIIGPLNYYGGGAGFGRRYNWKHICLMVNAGLKYAALPENLSDENRESFRVFYATGPGSIIDLNFRLGYQF